MGECHQRRWVAHAIASSLIGGCLLILPGGARQAQAGILQATYLGGRAETDARALAVDPNSGDIIFAGATTTADIPNTTSGAQPEYAGLQDAWVARLSPDLRTLKRATYLGGSAPEQADAVAIDPATGDIVVAGFTESTDFPGTTGGVQAALAGPSDIFIARLSGDLTTLRQATYLGGSADEGEALLGIAIERNSGDVIVAGSTASSDFPGTATGAQPHYGGSGDGFVARLNGDLKALVRATYVGDTGQDVVYDVAINPITAEIVTAGASTTSNFSRRFGAVNCFSSDLRYVKRIQYLANAGTSTNVWGLAMDSFSGDFVATGETAGSLESVQHGAQPTFGGGVSDAFAARFNSDLDLLQATYLGGSAYDGGIVKAAIRSGTGEVLVSGRTQSPDFSAVAGGAQAALNGGMDSFVARLSSGLTVLEQSTYLGGSEDDGVYALATNTAGSEVIAAGDTASTDFPGTAGGAQSTFASPPTVADPTAGFVVRISAALTADGATPTTAPPTPTPVHPTPTAASAAEPTATAAPTRTADCIGDCNGTRQVTIGNLITGVNVALGDLPLSACAALDANGDGRVAINELIEAVGNALNGCA